MSCCGLSSTGLNNIDANELTSDNKTVFSNLNPAGAAEAAAAWLLQQFSVWCALPMLCLLLALQCCITDVVEVSELS
jgi:hypothetical protein